ncbi:hypothetical protein PL71_01110 [Pseudoalteromonas distincta]|uniref:Lipoprotein n=1 Tax=Pseudoalteromonas distincta TaxID=77608 RepID=A0ABT9GJK1_9GAMM|nr:MULTISPECIES: hypothetical protein [Pseudoalteromonas]KHM50960.1 hypothetical protein PL71_01110 [Pseudoalteromonas elyakovii]KID35926.1 hypothetical protein QT16_14995 [Pseudoalteromonas distincta]MDN3475302.1 hypothetical protein [Pseudoalteromonas sp. APC 3355]MDP4485714.1 hypothetical protein [Pseudoalteromonas elyakovii]
MKMYFLLIVVFSAFFLNGCISQNPDPTPKLQHALLSKPNKTAVSKAIKTLVHIQETQLADNVFTTSSTVTLSNVDGNNIIDTQSRNTPDQFELMIKGKQCYIRHLDSKATIELKDVECRINEL